MGLVRKKILNLLPESPVWSFGCVPLTGTQPIFCRFCNIFFYLPNNTGFDIVLQDTLLKSQVSKLTGDLKCEQNGRL